MLNCKHSLQKKQIANLFYFFPLKNTIRITLSNSFTQSNFSQVEFIEEFFGIETAILNSCNRRVIDDITKDVTVNTLKKPIQTKNYKLTVQDIPKLDSLLKEIVQEYAEEMHSQFELYSDGKVEPIECLSRDGFIANSYNNGGYECSGFTEVNYLIGSGNMPSGKGAEKEINRQWEEQCKYALEAFKEKYKEEIKGIPEEKLNYHDLYELKLGNLAERLSELELDSDGQNTIMFNVRAMYNGVDEDGVHTVSVSACVNWEGPYHRSHISWMPGFKTEVAKEIEVTFKTLKQAEKRIRDAFKKVTKEIF